MEQLVAQQVEALSGRIGKLEEEHEDSKVDFRQQVKNLEEVVRSTLREELGGRPSTSAYLNTCQVHYRKPNGVCQFECSRGEQAGAPSTVVPARYDWAIVLLYLLYVLRRS